MTDPPYYPPAKSGRWMPIAVVAAAVIIAAAIIAIPGLPGGWDWDTPNIDTYISNHNAAVSFRACKHDDAIAYVAALEVTGPEAVTFLVNALKDQALLSDCDGATPRHSGCFAVLDLMDEQDCWFDNYCVPDQAAFDRIRQALALRVTSSDCDQGCN